MVPVLVLLFVALWFIPRGDLFYVLPFVILLLCFSVLLALRLPRFGKRELILVLFVCLFDLRLFGFICFLFLFLLVSRKGCGLWLWHFLDFCLYEYQSTLDDMQNARIYYPWNLVKHKPRVHSITWKPFKVSSRNFIWISINIGWRAERKNRNSCFYTFELFPWNLIS